LIIRHEPAWPNVGVDLHREWCRELIVGNGFRAICDLGGGRSPLLTPLDLRELDVRCTVLDVSAEELDRVPDPYERICQDICDPGVLRHGGTFDFVFSRMLAEHVRDGLAMHRHVFGLLKPGGMAFHFFPTLFNPVFVLNKLLPHGIGGRMLDAVVSREYERFPARYSMCFGPIPFMLRRLRGVGYEIQEFRSYHGTGYLSRIPMARDAERLLGHWTLRRRNRYLTSYACVILRRPASMTV
jgi:hypothetical protein